MIKEVILFAFIIYGLSSAQPVLTQSQSTTTTTTAQPPSPVTSQSQSTTTSTTAPPVTPPGRNQQPNFHNLRLSTTTTTTTAEPTPPVTPAPSQPLNFPQPPPFVILQSQPTTTTTTAPPTPLVTSPPPAGYVYGAYGQLCPASALSTRNTMCKSKTDIALDSRGMLYCEQDAGCCMCASIQCGFGTTPCREVIFGDYAAKFVGDILIKGQSGTTGAIVSCNGVESCLGATITGTNVEVIDCDAPRACQFAKVRITDPTEHFVIECGGVGACEGMEIELNFNGAPPGYRCAYLNNPTYIKPVFQLEGIECGAQSACDSIAVTINNDVGCRTVNVQVIECIEWNSCNAAVFDLLGDVTLQRCLCGASCHNAVGLESCYVPRLSPIYY